MIYGHPIQCRLIGSLLAGIIGLPLAAAGREITVTAQPREVFAGEPVEITVRVQPAPTDALPAIQITPETPLTLVDRRRHNVQSITIVNGQPRQTGFDGMIYTYRMTPEQPGRIHIGPVQVNVDGQTLTGDGGDIVVRPIEAQDRVRIDLSSSTPTAVPHQPFSIAIHIRIRTPAPGQPDLQPLHPNHPPLLLIPFLDTPPPDNLRRPSLQEVLAPRLLRTPQPNGFRINAIKTDRGLSGWGGFMAGFHDQEARFQLDHTRATSDGHMYHVYALEISFAAENRGVFTFGPVSMRGQIVTGLDRQGKPVMEDFFVRTPTLTVAVDEPSRAGRPDGFTGAVGTDMTVAAELDAQVCNEGDPLTLTLTLGGDIRMEHVTAPRISRFKELTAHFRVYDDSVRSETSDSFRRFHYTIRPLRAGTFEVPPLPLAFYDFADQRYRIVNTDPIPVRANRLTAAEIPGSGETTTVRLGTVPDTDIPAPFHFPTAPQPGVPVFAPRLHLPLLAGGPVAWTLLTATAAWRRRRLCSQSRRQRLAVAGTTRAWLDTAESLNAKERSHWHCLHRILTEFLTDAMAIPAGEVTPQSIARHLARRGIDEATAGAIVTTLETLASVVFSTHAPPDQSTFDATRRAVSDLVDRHTQALAQPDHEA